MNINIYKHTLEKICCFLLTIIPLSACDPYDSWGPECIDPTETFRASTLVQVNANNPEWIHSGVYALPGEKIEFTLFKDTAPITLCGKQTGSDAKIVQIFASESDWTEVLPEVFPNDRLEMRIGRPTAAPGANGNRWSLSSNVPTDWEDSPLGSSPSSPDYRYEYEFKFDGSDAGDQGNPACYGSTGAPCWEVYGKSALQPSNGWEYRVGGSTPTLFNTPEFDDPDLTVPDESPETPVDTRGIHHTAEAGGTGSLEIRLRDSSSYGDNQGGATFTIERYGCVISDGEKLQVAIGDRDTSVASADPNNASFSGTTSDFLDLSDLEGTSGLDDEGRIVKEFETAGAPYDPDTGDPTEYMSSSGGGVVWFRIVDDDTSGEGDGEYGDIDADPDPGVENWIPSNSGSYKLQVVTDSITGAESTFLSDFVNLVVDEIRQILNDVQENVYKGIIDGGFGSFVRTSLVLYVALWGAAFMVGLIQTPKFDFLIRMFKFSIIVVLMQPGSWEYFYENFFSLFNEGTAFVIHILNNLATGRTNTFDASSTIDFGLIDLTVGQFVTESFWIRVASLLFAGPFGWLFLIAIIYAAIIFTKGVILAIMSYVFAMVATAVLLGIAPLFMVFMLFNQTKDLFEAWVQELVNYSMRPIFVFTTLTVFNFLMLVMLHNVTNYGACWKCILNFDIGLEFLPRFCVFYFYQPEAYDNFNVEPSNYIPITIFDVIAVVLVAKMLERFIPFAESMVSSIVGSTGQASPIKAAQGTMDDVMQKGQAAVSMAKKYGGKALDTARDAGSTVTRAGTGAVSQISNNIPGIGGGGGGMMGGGGSPLGGSGGMLPGMGGDQQGGGMMGGGNPLGGGGGGGPDVSGMMSGVGEMGGQAARTGMETADKGVDMVGSTIELIDDDAGQTFGDAEALAKQATNEASKTASELGKAGKEAGGLASDMNPLGKGGPKPPTGG